MKNPAHRVANAVCRLGIAAIGLAASSWAALSMFPAPCRPIAAQPRVEIRATGSMSPWTDAHQGGAAG